MRSIKHLLSVVVVLVSCFSASGSDNHWIHNNIDDLQSKYNIQVLSEDPRVIIFDDFVTKEEGQALIEIGKPLLKRSTGGLERSVSSYRTSSNAWITYADIKDKTQRELVFNLEDRIADASNTPMKNQEHMQILHYSEGQFYKQHHDYIPEHQNMPCGPRAMTFFLYISDVDGGGQTEFPLLNISITPRRGRAVLWDNIDPVTGNQDPRTAHIAHDVTSGTKWAANKWIHTDNFYDNWLKGLTG